jgi:hypothetical protein
MAPGGGTQQVAFDRGGCGSVAAKANLSSSVGADKAGPPAAYAFVIQVTPAMSPAQPPTFGMRASPHRTARGSSGNLLGDPVRKGGNKVLACQGQALQNSVVRDRAKLHKAHHSIGADRLIPL